MPGRSEKKFCLTVLCYALVGPPVGLLSLFAMTILYDAWGPLTDRLSILAWHLQHISCHLPHGEHVDLRCLQAFKPREFPLNPIGMWKLDLRVLTYVVLISYMFGLLPALAAGFSIGGVGIRNGSIGFRQAVATGMVVGLVAAAAIGLMSHPPFSRPENAMCFFGMCFVATLVCWGAVRCWWRGAEDARD